MSEFKKYRRTNIAEMRPYIQGEDLNLISVSPTDNPPNDMGMIARDPKNHAGQWYVARKYFEDNFEEIWSCPYHERRVRMGDYDFIGNQIATLFVVCLISVPFGLWKLVDIIIWLIKHVSIGIK